jgi:hypothetical protein
LSFLRARAFGRRAAVCLFLEISCRHWSKSLPQAFSKEMMATTAQQAAQHHLNAILEQMSMSEKYLRAAPYLKCTEGLQTNIQEAQVTFVRIAVYVLEDFVPLHWLEKSSLFDK